MQQSSAGVSYFWHLPANASAHGLALDNHLKLNLWIAFSLLALLHVLLMVGLIARRRAIRPVHKLTLEYIPLIAFTALFGTLAFQAQRLWALERYTGADPGAMQVEVTGMQFAWYFRYPGADGTFGNTSLSLIAPGEGNPVGLDPKDSYGRDDIVSSQLVLPADHEVDLALRAVDVIHGFAIPELRLKQNAVPGQAVHVHFTPTAPGTYAILCTQVCGSGHYRMQATLRVLSQAEFDAWLSAEERKAHDAAVGAGR